MVVASTSKSSTTSTLIPVILRDCDPPPGFLAPPCQAAGASPVSAADTVLTPPAA
jgi:hypothetical protein